MKNRDRVLTLLHKAESTLGGLKLKRRGLAGIMARRFWRKVDSAWSAVYFATRLLEAEAKIEMADKTRCKATILVKDECSIISFQCEKPLGHSGPHSAAYPGQWGKVRIPMEWEGENQEVEFYRNRKMGGTTPNEP